MAKLELTFFRPNQSNNGHAAIFSYNDEKQNLFLTMMPQDGEKSFDSSQRIIAKLNLNDIGEMLAVLRGKSKGLGKKNGDNYSGLYHQTPDAVTIINLSEGKDKVFLSVSKKLKDGQPNKMAIALSLGDLELIEIYLLKIAQEMFVDNFKSENQKNN